MESIPEEGAVAIDLGDFQIAALLGNDVKLVIVKENLQLDDTISPGLSNQLEPELPGRDIEMYYYPFEHHFEVEAETVYVMESVPDFDLPENAVPYGFGITEDNFEGVEAERIEFVVDYGDNVVLIQDDQCSTIDE